MTVLYRLRIALLYLMLGLTAAVWCITGVVVTPFMSFRNRYLYIAYSWCRCAVWMTRWLVNIQYQVTGWEHVPKQPCVILSNHQSTWETFFLTGSFEPLTQVLKREILAIPFFGWAIWLLKPIAINRSNPKEALKQVAEQGPERLKKGIWILIFPEGTRTPVGQPGKFTRSGASIAAATGLPVLPIAHNAGMFWPKEGWSKRPGTIQVIIGPPMYAEGQEPRAVAELNQRAERWIREHTSQLERQESERRLSL
ncbi:1-acyl-sn-glycerol-3-phosphate acyltransferase [Azomonas agilis]|uniref:1-acyl-sn-glycerol-3-phosphate acyltransferase n=1 Tax=Azomonas agilis TaxID=116849 RepID=A0A562I0F6_9GAMM|nr:lysophospholipid acyltransferase family protein [Azomonas agilis]TWH64204.1 1-acyl-sn-glycerol-3-phosphate acyltransferase [Azomonas agilis]